MSDMEYPTADDEAAMRKGWNAMSKYPTREQAESISECDFKCSGCPYHDGCILSDTKNIASALYAMHDALDAKDAEIARLKAKLERFEQILAPDDDKPWREKGYDPNDTGCKPPYETTGVTEMKHIVYGFDPAYGEDVGCEAFGHKLPDGTVVIDRVEYSGTK